MLLKKDDPKNYRGEYNWYPENRPSCWYPDGKWQPVIHTDDERKKVLFADLAEGELCYPDSGLYEEGMYHFFYKNATPAEKEEFKNADNFIDGTRSFILRYTYTPPFMYDMQNCDIRNGRWGAPVAYVNLGANDFNSEKLLFLCKNGEDDNSVRMQKSDDYDRRLFAQKDEEAMHHFCRQGRILTPSIEIASHFRYPMVDYFLRDNFWEIDQLKIQLEDAKDLLYVYDKLKKRGLDYEAIRGWLKRQEKSSCKEKQEKAARVRKNLAVMDHLLTMPEKERFAEWETLLTPEMLRKSWPENSDVDRDLILKGALRLIFEEGSLDFDTLYPENIQNGFKEHRDAYKRAKASYKEKFENIPPLKTIKDPKEPTIWCKTVNGLWALLGVVDQTKYPHCEIPLYRKKGSNEIQ